MVEVAVASALKTTGLLPNVIVRPVEGIIVGARATEPAKPFRLVRLIRPVPDVPRGRVSEDGLIEMEKSDTMTRIETECASDPLVPVTVTV